MVKGIVKITVTGWVPVLLVVVCTFWAREKGLLVDTRVTRLVEGGDANLLVSIFLDDTEGVFMGIERSHENEGNIGTMGSVEVLDLTNGEIEEGHIILYLESALCAGHA